MTEIWVQIISSVGAIIIALISLITTSNKTQKEIKDIGKQLSDHIKEYEDSHAVSVRVRILAFDDALCDKSRPYPSEANFLQASSDCDTYEKYIDEHDDFHNGIGEAAIDHIREEWRKCKNENLFGKKKD